MALVLTRKDNQSVVIRMPDGVVITVKVEIRKGKSIRLHFTAPEAVKIWRSELDELDDTELVE